MVAIRFGLALLGSELMPKRNGCIWVNGDGIIESIEKAGSCPLDFIGGSTTVVLPQPALAHVHSADHAFPEYGIESRLQDLVAYPHGEKHRRLASLSRRDLVVPTRRYYRAAWRLGAGLLVDFRELGGIGCMTAKEAARELHGMLGILVLGRPGKGWPKGCDGVGVSSPLDYSIEELKRIVREAKVSATHVAENPETREMGDLELAVEAGFDFIVHGTYLRRNDVRILEDHKIGLVLSVRSNMWHGLGLPPIPLLFESSIPIGLGSDNASWLPPDVWREAEAVLLAARLQGARGTEAIIRVLRALFVDPYQLVDYEPRVIEEGRSARLLLFSDEYRGIVDAENPLAGVVKRIGGWNLYARIDGRKISFLGLPGS